MPDENLIPFEKALLCDIELIMPKSGLGAGGGKVKFQFPPKIISESNSINWSEIAVFSSEPVAIARGATARQVQMEWEYIATSDVFTGAKIAEELRRVKLYFVTNAEKFPTVMVRYGEILPELIPFRLMDVNIQYGPELVIHQSKPYPLYSKCTLTMKIATNLTITDKKKKKGDKNKVKQGGQLQTFKPKWA